MRALDPAFQAHLDSGATTLATCWRIARRDGAVLGFTDHDRALSFGGVAYRPESGAVGSAGVAGADLAVDNLEIEGALSADALSAEDLAAGRYDGAEVQIYLVNWAAPENRALIRTAYVGAVSRSGDAFRAELKSAAAALDRPQGRIFQRHCDAVLGDGRCGVDLDVAAFRTTGAVTDIVDESRFIASGFDGYAEDWFAHGALTWTSGANKDAVAHVKRQGAGGDIALWIPPRAGIAVGDAFTATAGCDKRFPTCREKFANGVNFRGFHLMPGNDFAVSYPLRGERNDGGRLR